MTRLRCLRQLRRGRLQIVALIVALVILAPRVDALFAQSATGRVTGSVKLTMASSAPSAAAAYERRSVGPRPKPQPELRNVVVFFADLAATKSAPMQASIAQRDEQFVPHVVAVTAGSSVAFPNQDPFFHNVFSLSRGASFNLGRYPSGASRSRVVTRPGIIKVFCEIHSHMSAVIRVFDHPWFGVPSDEGTFSIDNVPAGEHTLTAWHERIGERRDRVTIRPGATTQVTFTLPVLEATP
jgi:plastocyanin